MLQTIETPNDNVLAFKAVGKVTGQDYEETLIPAVEAALETHAKIRFLYELSSEFEGFSARAMLDDAKVGFRHLGEFERIAIVSDVRWIVDGIKLFAFAIPYPVKVFPTDQREAALAWITDVNGGDHATR